MIPVVHPDKWIDKTQIFSIDAQTQATNNSNADSNPTFDKPLELETHKLGNERDLFKNEVVLDNITGDTALVSQQVINKEEVLRDSVNTLQIPKESSVEMKIKTRMKNKKRKAKAKLSQSCKINKDIEKPE